ncbi:hypothetical protein [Paenibacillus sp. OAS669]|uniref:hypothetical protein n=1 Tax=Paenibacillus sp. OAS669 TaxID=2663821 RepID=UPI00178A324D|nr:hypothetical protein [Paenibacillus sp. OAS669]MBE1447153.1 hypothetical protein [Paenibacillus sp. OAS669]
MRHYALVLCIGFLIMLIAFPAAADANSEVMPTEYRQDLRQAPAMDGEVTPQGYRSGRGSFSRVRTPAGRGTTTTPNRNPANVTTNPRTNPPTTGTPARGGWGSLFGGFAAGALIGSLFNPFGFMGFGPGAGTPFSFIGLIFWAVVIYLVYRLFTRSRRNES